MPTCKKGAVSRFTLVLALAIVITSAFAIYLAAGGSIFQASPQNTANISLETVSIDPSTSNLSATLNVDNNFALTHMSLFINNTLVGSYNYSSNAEDQCCLRIMNTWGNGTSSFFFTATPYYMPMMGNWNWECCGMMGGNGGYGSYEITIMAMFANGRSYNASAILVPDQQGSGWMMR